MGGFMGIIDSLVVSSTITPLQSNIASPIWGAGTTANKTFGSNCTPGSRIVVVCTQENPAGTFTISDPTNGTYPAADATGSGGVISTTGSGKSSIFSVVNTASTALTITMTVGIASGGSFAIYELPACSFDAGSSGLGGSSSLLTGSLGISADAFVIACGTYYTSGGVVDAGYDSVVPESVFSWAYHFAEKINNAGSAGTETLNFGFGSNRDNWSLAIASYIV